MTNKVSYKVLSAFRCKCRKFLKVNLVRKKGTNAICFACFQKVMESHPAPVRTARQVRTNPHLRSQKRLHVPLRRISS